jgi:hypothetical protein
MTLRSLGYAPGNFDILFYYSRSQPARAKVLALVVSKRVPMKPPPSILGGAIMLARHREGIGGV